MKKLLEIFNSYFEVFTFLLLTSMTIFAIIFVIVGYFL